MIILLTTYYAYLLHFQAANLLLYKKITINVVSSKYFSEIRLLFIIYFIYSILYIYLLQLLQSYKGSNNNDLGVVSEILFTYYLLTTYYIKNRRYK